MFDAAIELFTERGYSAVTLGDIAKQVGLARNSLYRYFPTKASILLRWYAEELPVQAARSRELLAGDDAPARRIGRWAEAQLDYVQQPEHRLLAALGEAAADLDPDDRAVLAAGHDDLLAPLRGALADAGLTGDALSATADQVWGAVLVQSRRELDGGEDAAGRAVLTRTIAALARDPS